MQGTPMPPRIFVVEEFTKVGLQRARDNQDPRAESLPQDLVLLLELRAYVLLMPVYPSGQHHQEHAHGFYFHPHPGSLF